MFYLIDIGMKKIYIYKDKKKKKERKEKQRAGFVSIHLR